VPFEQLQLGSNAERLEGAADSGPGTPTLCSSAETANHPFALWKLVTFLSKKKRKSMKELDQAIMQLLSASMSA
jgi:hypothetical protein